MLILDYDAVDKDDSRCSEVDPGKCSLQGLRGLLQEYMRKRTGCSSAYA
jgi:hypothetical protein